MKKIPVKIPNINPFLLELLHLSVRNLKKKKMSEKEKLMWVDKSSCHLTSSLLQESSVLSFITLYQKVA